MSKPVKNTRAGAAAKASAPAAASSPPWLMPLCLAVAVLLLYWPALQHRFVNYDDDHYVTENARVQNGLSVENLGWVFVNPVAENWHPLTVLSHMAVCQFAGVNPWAHHFVNVLLHAANAALVFILLRLMTGSFWRSAFVAALFAFHPLRVESVAWVAERKDVLSGFFGLLTLIFYARYAKNADAGKGSTQFFSSRDYWLAWGCLVLGLMSKPMLVTWPFVMLLLDGWPLQRISYFQFPISNLGPNPPRAMSVGRLIIEKVPFLVVSAGASVVTFLVQQRGAAVQSVENLPLAMRGGNSVVACCRYLGKTFWPVDLSVFYPYPQSWPVWEVTLAALFLAVVCVLAWVWWRKQPFLFTGWFWFLGTLVPVIGLVQVGMQSMADRYTYLPSLGVAILVVWGVETNMRRHGMNALAALAGVIAIAGCMFQTRAQLKYWHDSETLFRHAIAVTRDNSLAHFNLGAALDSENRIEEAMAEYRAVLRVQPTNAISHLNLGADLYKSGRIPEAIAEYHEVIRAEPNNERGHNNLGIALLQQGRLEEATKELQEAIRLNPGSAASHNSLGAVFYTSGQIERAVVEFREALRLQPDYPEAHFNLGCMMIKQDQNAEAIRHFQEALRLKPDYAEAREWLARVQAEQHP